jgi:hypothetical protein
MILGQSRRGMIAASLAHAVMGSQIAAQNCICVSCARSTLTHNGFAVSRSPPNDMLCRGAFDMTFGSEFFLDGVVRTTRRATIRWVGEARDDIFGHEPVLVARCCSPAKLLPGFSKFVGVPRCDDPRRNHPCCWHSHGGPAAMASCRTSKQLRRIGDRNDRRPS